VRAIREFTGVDVRTGLDLGANIGLTTAYFGAVYPEARILAVEPHPGSFQMLKRNTAPLGERVDAFQAAFWVSDEPLGWASDQFRDGRDWSRSVERVTDAEDTVDVVTPAGALGRLGVERVDLAKIDIEGSEAEFFATDEATEALLGLADVFAIELHLEVVDPLRTAMAFERGGFLTIPTGDYVIAIRRSRMVEN
jgi:FkbM family methyltransferase